MTKYERETVINYNDEDGTATVYTCNAALIRQMEGYCAKNPLFLKVKSDDCSATYTFPKKCVKIRLPRVITEENRAKLASRAKDQFAAYKEGKI